MSVRRSDWILIGTDIGMEYYDNANDERKDELLERDENAKVGEITYLIDGMSGDYFIIGLVIAVDKDGYSGLPLTEINLEDNRNYDSEIKMVYSHVKEEFGEEIEPKMIVLTHWS